MMLDDFLTRAVLAGFGTALAAGPLGCFVVWRRMAYFGDATAHAAVLGVALALGFALPVFWGTLAVALIMALTVVALAGRGHGEDTILGVLAHSALAFGLLAVWFLPDVRVDLSVYLFGDILTISKSELGLIWCGAIAVLGLLVWRWSALITTTLNEDLAQASGINPGRERLILTLTLALVVAVAIKTVGALLITAILIIPAATARSFARTPEMMAVGAVILGCIAVAGGLWASLHLNTQTGPSIVAIAATIFAAFLTFRKS